jgi:hypothetical protein
MKKRKYAIVISLNCSVVSSLSYPTSFFPPQAFSCRKSRETSSAAELSRTIDYIYKSVSSSSGSGMLAAASISFWYCSRTAWSTWTSGGARAGAATNSRDWLPTSLRASQLMVVSEMVPNMKAKTLTGKASRNCSWTWPRCRSTEGSFCDGR